MTVVSLSGATLPGSREPDAEVVEMLEGLLREAKDGLIHGLAIAAVIDDATRTGWRGDASCHLMTAAVARLHYRFMRDDLKD